MKQPPLPTLTWSFASTTTTPSHRTSAIAAKADAATAIQQPRTSSQQQHNHQDCTDDNRSNCCPYRRQSHRSHGPTINFVKLVVGLTIFRRWRAVHGTEGQPSPAAGFAMALPKGPASPNNNSAPTSTTTSATDAAADTNNGNVENASIKTGNIIAAATTLSSSAASNDQHAVSTIRGCTAPQPDTAGGIIKATSKDKKKGLRSKSTTQQHQQKSSVDRENGNNVLNAHGPNAMVNQYVVSSSFHPQNIKPSHTHAK